jgi:hypothetical protein
VPLVIGVTGHRNILPGNRAMARLVRNECVRLRREHPKRKFVVLSPLAEGADRLVARIAMDVLDARLVVPLPLPLDDADGYLKDFPGSVRAFKRLLAKADDIVPGPLPSRGSKWRDYSEARNRQYAWVGGYVAGRADVLFALWDGKPSRGTGGTAQVVRWYLGGKVPKAYALETLPRPASARAAKSRRKGKVLVHINPETGTIERIAAA